MIRSLVLLALLLTGGTLSASEGTTPNNGIPPRPTHYVTDQAGVLSATTSQALNQQLDLVERQTSNQILVAIYPHLPEGAEIAQFATDALTAWGVGQKGKDNGVVLFIFVQDHKLFIAPGRGLEGALPDALCKRIVTHEIVPRFKQGDFSGGVQAGINAIVAASQGEYHGTGTTVGDRGQETPSWVSILFFLFVLIIFIILASRGQLGAALPYVISSSGGNWSGGRSGGGGGGNFFSGGGGSSSGGGAGGSW